MTLATTPDPHRSTRAHAASGRAAAFTDATVLEAADVHVATTLARLGGDADEFTALAIAFAVRAVRHGSVTVDLSTIAESATVEEGVDVDVSALPWPDPDAWVDAVRASPLVADGDDAPERDPEGRVRPVRLLGTEVALDRYWRHERAIAADLLNRLATPPATVDRELLHDGLDRLFDGEPPDLQRIAAATAVLRTFSVIAGGPGTGKTTTVAGVLALLHEQARAAGRPLRVALAAPTGKAAARLTEAVHAQAAELDVDDDIRALILGAEASTIHRLLGRAPGSNSRFRHDRTNQLPHQVVVIDETSMVSLTLMARLVEAVRPSARLVLVGDPQQLTSVEAGAVLGDIVGPAADGFRGTTDAADELADVSGHRVPVADEAPGSPIGDGIVVLRAVHRFTGAIGSLATAIESGDAEATVAILGGGDETVRWFDADVASADGVAAMDEIRPRIVGPASEVVDAARSGDAATALQAMRAVQVLCAHRSGPHGVAVWRSQIEAWLAAAVDGFVARGWYAGRPLLVTENDYALDLFNGDTGVVVATGDDRLACAFERRREIVTVGPSRLRAVETLYAMTIHKSQGSQFGEVVVVLPDEASPILTRELLYTAVTRAEKGVLLVGTETAIRAAVERPVSRASGLRERLWG